MDQFFAACESRMERSERLTRTHIRIATILHWVLFFVSLAASAGVILLAMADGPLVLVCILAGVVAVTTYVLVSPYILWRAAGRWAEHLVELSRKGAVEDEDPQD